MLPPRDAGGDVNDVPISIADHLVVDCMALAAPIVVRALDVSGGADNCHVGAVHNGRYLRHLAPQVVVEHCPVDLLHAWQTNKLAVVVLHQLIRELVEVFRC